MPAAYVEVRVHANSALLDNLVAVLGQIGFEGFWEDEGCLKAYMRSERWTPAMGREVEETIALLARTSADPMPQLTIETIPDRNWNEEWERTIRPIAVTPRIVITPSWHAYAASQGEIVLTIDPKMSFGTGYHESTRLVLRLMDAHVKAGSKVLDVGTGTGILAIAAVRLGARSAVGLDTDEWAYDNARENTVLNRVADRVTILHGGIALAPPGAYDLILANIQRTIILELLDDLTRLMAPDGTLILSGLLRTDEEEVRSSLLQRTLHVVERETENEWLALLVQKQP